VLIKPRLVRTDFSNDEAWELMCKMADEIPSDMDMFLDVLKQMNPGCDVPKEARGSVEFVSDRQFENFSIEQLLARNSKDAPGVIFVADRETMAHADHPVLVVDTSGKTKPFRAVPNEVASIADNIVTSNMDLEEFSTCCDSEGIFRGF
jgi:hypothetical protein